MRRILAICFVSSLLCSCATLVPNPGEPTKKYTLSSLADQGSSLGDGPHRKHPHQLNIDLPSLYPPIDSARIALKPQEQLIDYYADVEWADRLSALIQESLIYSFQSRAALQGVSRPTEGINADYALKVEIRKFYVDHNDAEHTLTAKVDYMVHLVKLPERKIVASQEFSHGQAITQHTMDNIIKSLNYAHLEVSKKLVSWVISNMY